LEEDCVVTKLLAFCACVAALVALLVWPGNADPARHARGQDGDKVSADDVDATLRRSGLTPVGPIRRSHDAFVTHAIDMRGTKLRVVADALFGDIVSVAPAQPAPIYATQYTGHGGAGPRIIHIPQAGDVGAAPQTDDGDASAAVEDDAPVAAPPRRYRAAPPARDMHREPRRKPYQQSRRTEPANRISARAVPPAAAPVEVKAKRSVLAIPAEPVQPKAETLPPPPATPRWQSAEKFEAPRDAVGTKNAVATPAAEDAHASADAPAAVAPVAPDTDLPPEGITADPLPAR
jgi:hypothetical protein